ncbi:MAG TPA: hypothetical protein VMR52_08470 [Dehalococcoidia bacterium]|nr:hypothetical protein [Dehalococcoidia bacterium]
MNLRRLLYPLLVIALALTAACGDDDGDNSSPSDTATGTARPTAPSNLPADFPEHFPLYEESSLEQSARFEDQALVLFLAPAGISEVADFYRGELASEPWTITSDNDSALGETITLSYRNELDGLRGTVTLSEPSPGLGTEVNIRVVGLPNIGMLATPVPTENAASETPSTGEAE